MHRVVCVDLNDGVIIEALVERAQGVAGRVHRQRLGRVGVVFGDRVTRGIDQVFVLVVKARDHSGVQGDARVAAGRFE